MLSIKVGATNRIRRCSAVHEQVFQRKFSSGAQGLARNRSGIERKFYLDFYHFYLDVFLNDY